MTWNRSQYDKKSKQLRWTAQSSYRWLPRSIKSMFPAPFSLFPGPLWSPKIDQQSTLGAKSGARKRCFVDFCCENRFSDFRDCFFIDSHGNSYARIDAFLQGCAGFVQLDERVNLCTGAVFWAIFTIIFLEFVKDKPEKQGKTND